MRILVTSMGLACAAVMLMTSYAEKQQEVALETLSTYKLKPEPVLDDDPDLKLVTARSSVPTTSTPCETRVQSERPAAAALPQMRKPHSPIEIAQLQEGSGDAE